MKKKEFKEFWELFKLILKKDPMYIAAWIIILKFTGECLGLLISIIYSIVYFVLHI